MRDPIPRRRPLGRATAVWCSSLGLSAVILGCWCFPSVWYSAAGSRGARFWLAEQRQVSGWQFQEEPVSKAAESVLAAEEVVNGQFVRAGGTATVRVFSAKHYGKQEEAMDMFSHTPDRCWTSVGWRETALAPDHVIVEIHGLPVNLERRLFVHGGDPELVLFGALVGGQPLPYRLDQYQSMALRRTATPPSGIFGRALEAVDAKLLSWPLRAFLERRPLRGPKQFIRVSTPVQATDVRAADKLLTDFLPLWLTPLEYEHSPQ